LEKKCLKKSDEEHYNIENPEKLEWLDTFAEAEEYAKTFARSHLFEIVKRRPNEDGKGSFRYATYNCDRGRSPEVTKIIAKNITKHIRNDNLRGRDVHLNGILDIN
jgi:hypothetical protein